MGDTATFDLDSLTPDDPYSPLAAARSSAPVMMTGSGFACALSYDACDTALRHPSFTSGLIAERYRAALPPGPAQDELAHRINFLDPPDHPRVRGLVSRVFTPGRVRELRPWIEAECERLLDAVDVTAPFDLRACFAHQLPSYVISEMLGVPLADRDQLTAWTEAVTPLLGVQLDPVEKAAALEASAQFAAYAEVLIAERRADPRDDLLSALVAAEDGDERLSHPELLSLVVTLYSAGHRTTRDLFTNGLHALLSAGAYGEVAAEPALVPSAVEEMLRLQTPTLFVARVTAEPVELAGVALPTWTPVLVFLAAANRDPARFSDPERFDVRRDEGASLSFAFGAHHCLGASLARMEAQLMLEAVTRRWPDLALADGFAPQWWRSGPFRGLGSLTVDAATH